MLEGLGGPSSGRSSASQSADERLWSIRIRAAELFGFRPPERVIFTPGATFALNQALSGCLQPGDRVLGTRLEHNAVLRPLHALQKSRALDLDWVGFSPQGFLDLQQLQDALRKKPCQWLILGLCSNVLGTIQPVAEACALAREHGARVILDMAQGGGYVPVDLDAWQVSAAAVAGHKGLHGPRGTGLLFVAQDLNPEPIVRGGTGIQGMSMDMPAKWPIHLEAGTRNYPGIYGLGAALEYLQAHPPNLDGLRLRMEALENSLRAHPGLEVYPPQAAPWSQRLGILSFRAKAVPSEILAGFLEQQGIQVRSGVMCASLAAGALSDGQSMLRLSPDLHAPESEFKRVKDALTEALACLQ